MPSTHVACNQNRMQNARLTKCEIKKVLLVCCWVPVRLNELIQLRVSLSKRDPVERGLLVITDKWALTRLREIGHEYPSILCSMCIIK